MLKEKPTKPIKSSIESTLPGITYGASTARVSYTRVGSPAPGAALKKQGRTYFSTCLGYERYMYM